MTRSDRVDPPTSRMVVAILSMVGFFVAFYLMAYSLGWMGSLICGISSCETVQQSSYSKIGPVPVAAIGAAIWQVRTDDDRGTAAANAVDADSGPASGMPAVANAGRRTYLLGTERETEASMTRIGSKRPRRR